jgi:hypothetical protein
MRFLLLLSLIALAACTSKSTDQSVSDAEAETGRGPQAELYAERDPRILNPITEDTTEEKTLSAAEAKPLIEEISKATRGTVRTNIAQWPADQVIRLQMSPDYKYQIVDAKHKRVLKQYDYEAHGGYGAVYNMAFEIHGGLYKRFDMKNSTAQQDIVCTHETCTSTLTIKLTH